MKKFSSEKKFKATLATAVAAGAFVAIAPVNTEAAPTFSDVKDTAGGDLYDAVMNYTSKDMISGYPDGKFKPNQGITRQDAAKLLALALELDIVNVKDPGFKDVSKTNPNYNYIAALVEIGVISGYADNTFRPEGTLSRGQMSKIIVRGFELKDVGAIQLPFKDINDRQEYAGYVRALYANEITVGTTATTFSPNVLVTRGQMASFVFRSEAKAAPKRPTQSELDKTAVEAAANTLTAGTVTVSRGNSATDANKLAAVQTYVTSLITEKDVKVTVAASTIAGNYVVTLVKGEAKVEKLITMAFNNAADDRFVTEVTAVNAKQMVVKFATPVTKASVLNSANEIQNITFTMVSGATVNPGKLKGSLSEDGKTLTITANWIFDGEYAVKSTEAIQAAAGGKYEEYTAIVKANDKVAPKLLSGTATAKVSTNTFAVFFDEPVSAAGATAYVDDVIATVVNNSTDPNRLDVTTSKQVSAGTTARIKMLSVKDYNQNLLAPNPSETTVTISADTVAPTVTKVNILGENKVEIVYDKNMNLASFVGKARLVYSNGTVTNLTATAGANAKTVILTGAGLPVTNNYNAVLFIDAEAKDTVGNSTAHYTSNLTLSKDTIAPVMTSVEYKEGKLVATFTEDIAAGRLNTVTVTDQKTGAPRQITLTNTNRVITNNTLVISEYLPDAAYQLYVPANTVTDKASTPNSNAIDIQTFVVKNTLSSDTTRPVVGSITSIPSANAANQTVTYKVIDNESGVDLESVLRLGNYSWNGQDLPFGTLITTNASLVNKNTDITVTINIPTAGIPMSNTAPFTIHNIRDNVGNVTELAATKDIYLYGVNQNGPVLSNAYINGTSLMFSFNEPVNNFDVNDLEIRINDMPVSPTLMTTVVPANNANSNLFSTSFNASLSMIGGTEGTLYLDNNRNGVIDMGDILISTGNYQLNGSNPIPVQLNTLNTLTVKLIHNSNPPVQNKHGVNAVFGNKIEVLLR